MSFSTIKMSIFCWLVTTLAPAIGYTQTSVPFHVSNVGDLDVKSLSVEILLDGQKKTFNLDTGAGRTMVKSDDQTRNFKRMDSVKSQGASGQQTVCNGVSIPAIALGDFVRLSLPGKQCDSNVGGTNNLGIDFFEGMIISINSKKSQLNLNRKPIGGFYYYPMKRFSSGANSLLGIPLTIGSQAIYGAFDTGAAMTAVDLKFVQAHPTFFELYSRNAGGYDVNGQVFKAYIYKVKSLRIGPMILNDIFVSVFDFKDMRDYLGDDSPVIIGNNIILKANWILDLQSNLWAIGLL